MQSFHRPTVTPSGQKKGVLSRAANKALLLGLHFTSAPGKDNVRGEPVFIETSEKQERETVVMFNISWYLVHNYFSWYSKLFGLYFQISTSQIFR